MSSKERENLNDQLEELFDLIDKEKDQRFSIASLQRKPNKFSKKWFIVLTLLGCLCLSIILANDQWSYNLYFIILSFIRLLLLQVSETDIRSKDNAFLSR